jgi:hypothetical protein
MDVYMCRCTNVFDISHVLLGLVYFFGIFTSKRYEDMRDLVFTQYSQIPSNTSKKYSTMMESFYSSQKYTSVERICGDILELSSPNPD